MHEVDTKKRRMHRLFRANGRSLIVAMDHGAYMPVLPQLQDTGRVIRELREAGADALLTTLGNATRYADDIGTMGLILRLDGAASTLDSSHSFSLRHSVLDALRIGADGVACMGFPGSDDCESTLDNVAHVAGECLEWSMPFMAEMLPGAFDKRLHTVDNIALAARIGVELGADIIKTAFVGEASEYRHVSDGVYGPVVVLGGSRKESDEDLLSMVRKAVDGGARGVAVGRNIWQHEDVGGITRALVRVIHEDAPVDDAMTELIT
jgi:DhnA family fructose-bisphosphate aldolase class Ia